MCDVLDRIENRGIEKGEAQVMRNMYQKGYSLEQIADVAEKTIEEVRSIIAQEKTLLPQL